MSATATSCVPELAVLRSEYEPSTAELRVTSAFNVICFLGHDGAFILESGSQEVLANDDREGPMPHVNRAIRGPLIAMRLEQIDNSPLPEDARVVMQVFMHNGHVGIECHRSSSDPFVWLPVGLALHQKSSMLATIEDRAKDGVGMARLFELGLVDVPYFDYVSLTIRTPERAPASVQATFYSLNGVDTTTGLRWFA